MFSAQFFTKNIASPRKKTSQSGCKLDLGFMLSDRNMFFGLKIIVLVEPKGAFTRCDLSGRFRILVHVIYVRR